MHRRSMIVAEHSKIEWTDHTFNTHWGCSEISPGCDGCYAKRLAARFGYGWGDDAPKREFDERHWDDLVKWDRKALAEGVRRRVFTNSMSDLFDKFAPDGVRERHFGYVERTPNLDHLLLTKRIGNVPRMVPARWLEPDGWPTNAWIGATVVNQEEADRDIPKLMAVPARVRFLSIEPMLGPIDLTRDGLVCTACRWCVDASADPDTGAVEHCRRCEWTGKSGEWGIDWVIAGGESGPHARPAHLEWFRTLRDQCAAAGVPFLFKQWGEWAPATQTDMGPAEHTFATDQRVDIGCGRSLPFSVTVRRVGKKAAGRLLDGVTHDDFPAAPQAGEDGG
jgi:protein gp37